MEIFRLVKAIEELIFEVSLWLLTYPKTLYQVLVRPDWVQGYIRGELTKDERERFDDYMSPAVFYVLNVVLVVVPRLVSVGNIEKSILSNPLVNLFIGSPDRLVATSAVVLAACPLGFAWVAGIGSKRRASRTTLREPLLGQFLIAGTFILFVAPSFSSRINEMAGELLGGIAIAWFCLAEWLFYRHYLNVGRIRAAGLVIAGFGAWSLANTLWGLLLALSLFVA